MHICNEPGNDELKDNFNKLLKTIFEGENYHGVTFLKTVSEAVSGPEWGRAPQEYRDLVDCLTSKSFNYVQNNMNMTADNENLFLTKTQKKKDSSKNIKTKTNDVEEPENEKIPETINIPKTINIYLDVSDNDMNKMLKVGDINPKYVNGDVLMIGKNITHYENNFKPMQTEAHYLENGHILPLPLNETQIARLKQVLQDHHSESKHVVLSLEDFNLLINAPTLDDVKRDVLERVIRSNKMPTWQYVNDQIDALQVVKEQLEEKERNTIYPQSNSTLFKNNHLINPVKLMLDKIAELEQDPADKSSIERTLKFITIKALDQHLEAEKDKLKYKTGLKNEELNKDSILFKNIANLMDIDRTLQQMKDAILNAPQFEMGYVWNAANNTINVNDTPVLVPTGVRKIYGIIGDEKKSDEEKLSQILAILKDKLSETKLTRSKSTIKFYKNMYKLLVLKNGIELKQAMEAIKSAQLSSKSENKDDERLIVVTSKKQQTLK